VRRASAPEGESTSVVSSRDVRHLHAFHEGCWVVTGEWLGRVQDLEEDAIISFVDVSSAIILNTTYTAQLYYNQ